MKAGKVTEIIIFQCKICKTRLKVCKSQSVCKFPFSIFPTRSNFYVITVYQNLNICPHLSFIYIYNNKLFSGSYCRLANCNETSVGSSQLVISTILFINQYCVKNSKKSLNIITLPLKYTACIFSSALQQRWNFYLK